LHFLSGFRFVKILTAFFVITAFLVVLLLFCLNFFVLRSKTKTSNKSQGETKKASLFLSGRGLSGFVRKETKGDVSKFLFDLWNVRDVFLFDVKNKVYNKSLF
jgi:hypothetical protein